MSREGVRSHRVPRRESHPLQPDSSTTWFQPTLPSDPAHTGPPRTGVPFVVIPVQGSVRRNAAPSPRTPTQQEEKASEQRQQLSQQGRSAGDRRLGD